MSSGRHRVPQQYHYMLHQIAEQILLKAVECELQ